jgi:hypothetical protein
VGGGWSIVDRALFSPDRSLSKWGLQVLVYSTTSTTQRYQNTPWQNFTSFMGHSLFLTLTAKCERKSDDGWEFVKCNGQEHSEPVSKLGQTDHGDHAEYLGGAITKTSRYGQWLSFSARRFNAVRISRQFSLPSCFAYFTDCLAVLYLLENWFAVEWKHRLCSWTTLGRQLSWHAGITWGSYERSLQCLDQERKQPVSLKLYNEE